MAAESSESIIKGYTDSAGVAVGDGYRLKVGELAWLAGHSARLNELRLELLKSLQSALPRYEEGVVPELKDVLTNLIIMQTRLAEREQRMGELLKGLVESGLLESVPVDRDGLEDGIRGIREASEHVEGRAQGCVINFPVPLCFTLHGSQKEKERDWPGRVSPLMIL